MRYLLSFDPYIEVSQEAVDYLRLERKWLKTDRPEELYDILDTAWGALSSEDRMFMGERGFLAADDNTWTSGNGFQFSMLDAVPELE